MTGGGCGQYDVYSNCTVASFWIVGWMLWWHAIVIALHWRSSESMSEKYNREGIARGLDENVLLAMDTSLSNHKKLSKIENLKC